jgi:hypothetical protein
MLFRGLQFEPTRTTLLLSHSELTISKSELRQSFVVCSGWLSKSDFHWLKAKGRCWCGGSEKGRELRVSTVFSCWEWNKFFDIGHRDWLVELWWRVIMRNSETDELIKSWGSPVVLICSTLSPQKNCYKNYCGHSIFFRFCQIYFFFFFQLYILWQE